MEGSIDKGFQRSMGHYGGALMPRSGSQIHQKEGKVQATSIDMKNIKGKLGFKG